VCFLVPLLGGARGGFSEAKVKAKEKSHKTEAKKILLCETPCKLGATPWLKWFTIKLS
jgi:hypothetical protein